MHFFYLSYSSKFAIKLAISSAAKASSSPLAVTVMLAPLVTPKDKTPIKLLTLAFFPLNSMLTSDLKDEAFLTN